MRIIRTLVAGSIACLLAAPFVADPAGADEGKLNITIINPHDKPGAKVYWTEGVLTGIRTRAGKGRVVLIHASSGTREYLTALYVADDAEIGVTTTLGPRIEPETAYKKAVEAQKSESDSDYRDGYNALKYAITELDRVDRELTSAIDAWAKDNNLPTLSIEKIDRQLATAEKLGAGAQDKEAVAILTIYKNMLEEQVRRRNWLDSHKAKLASLKPPARKSVMLPGPCPQGQGDGLLAGQPNVGSSTNGGSDGCDGTAKQGVTGVGAVSTKSPPHLIRPIRSLQDLRQVVIHEATYGTTPNVYEPGATALMARLPDPLGEGNNDFTFYEGEYYDVFYSDAGGRPDANGAYITIEGVWRYDGWNSGSMNIAEVELRFGGEKVDYGDFVSSAVFGSICAPERNAHCIAGSEALAADNDVGTFPRFGQTSLTNLNDRFRVTIGFNDSESGAEDGTPSGPGGLPDVSP